MATLLGALGHGLSTVGRAYDYLTPGAGASTLTDVGRGMYGRYNDTNNPLYAQNNYISGQAPISGIGTDTRPVGSTYGVLGASTTNSSSGGGNLSGGGAGGATSDPNLAAQYADQANQLQGQFGTLDGQLQNGQQTINNSYGQALGGIQDQFGLAQHTYDTNKQQNAKDYLSTSNNARTQVRAQSNALQRLLGMNGAGNSSASLEQAPYAAALAGSQLINGAQSTYAKNAANQDNNFAQTKLTTENAKKKLAQDKAAKEQKLQQDVATSRATLLDQIRQANINHDLALGKNYQSAAAAQAGTQSQVQSLLQQIQGLGRVDPISYDSSQIQYATPDQAQYSLDGGAQIQPGTTGAESNVDPTFLSLLTDPKKKTDPYGNPLFA